MSKFKEKREKDSSTDRFTGEALKFMRYSILILVFAIVLSCGCASADKRVELASVSGLTITGINIKQSDGTMKNESLLKITPATLCMSIAMLCWVIPPRHVDAFKR